MGGHHRCFTITNINGGQQVYLCRANGIGCLIGVLGTSILGIGGVTYFRGLPSLCFFAMAMYFHFMGVVVFFMFFFGDNGRGLEICAGFARAHVLFFAFSDYLRVLCHYQARNVDL